MPMPIPVPMAAPQRDCVVINQHTYCRDEESSNKVAGEALLISAALLVWAALFVGWAALFVWLAAERDKPKLAGAVVLVPLVVAGLYLLIRSK